MTGTVKTARVRTNRYAANCNNCGHHIPANTGQLAKTADGWIVRCADTDACATRTAATTTQTVSREAQLAADPGQSGFYTATEETVIIAAGIDNPFDARIEDVLAAAGLRTAAPAPVKPARRATSNRRRKACTTGGNCSSYGLPNCGGHNCDAN